MQTQHFIVKKLYYLHAVTSCMYTI